MLRIGAIGDRNHAARMIQAIQGSKRACVTSVYHPDRVPDFPGGTSDFEDLLSCDAVMILSPNATHFDYLIKLSDCYSGYIFCEKPPVTNKDHLAKIECLNWKNTFFNFNFRHSKWAEILNDECIHGSIGKIVNVNITWTHGLAFSDAYASSWRSDKTRHDAGILETVSIHALDLLIGKLGAIENFINFSSNMSAAGTADDTSMLTMKHESGATSNLLCSYATPYTMCLSILGTEGIVVADEHKIQHLGPRDTFNNDGRFMPPPVISSMDWDSQSMYQASISKNTEYFLDVCCTGGSFPKDLFTQSISTTGAMLSIADNTFKQ